MNAPIDNYPSSRSAPSSIAPPPSSVGGVLSSSQAATAARAVTMQMAQNPPLPTIDVGAIKRRLFAHWQVILVCLVIGALVTSQVVNLRVATYKSETVIYFREGIGRNLTGPGENPDAVKVLGTKLKEQLLAQKTLRGLIDEFHLYPDLMAKRGYSDAVDMLRKKTDFKSRSTDTFAIGYDGPDNETAQKVCARMADILIKENAKQAEEEARGASEFLDLEKRRTDDELDSIERDISAFLQAHPEFASAKEGLGIETFKRLNADKAASAPRRGGGGARTRREAPASPVAKGPAIDPVLIAERRSAAAAVGAARRDLDEKANRFTEQHPDVQTSRARLAVAQAALERAQDAVSAAEEAKAEAAPRKIVAGDDPYGDPQPDAGVKPSGGGPVADKRKPHSTSDDRAATDLEIEWSRLVRDLEKAKTHESELEKKVYKTEMLVNTAEQGHGSSIVVLDPAFKPTVPSNAPNTTVALIGLGISLAVGIVLSAAWGLFLDDRLFGANELEPTTLVPMLGVIPKRTGKMKKGKGKKNESAVEAMPSYGAAGPTSSQAAAQARTARPAPPSERGSDQGASSPPEGGARG